HYVLPTTNLKAQKRFVSSIARRLDQLGALTRGQRQATSQGMFTASDNLESEYATTALHNFFVDLYRERTPLSFQTVTRQMGLNLLDQDGAFEESKSGVFR
ncbi:MAG TPA: strawberry notch C-terminal domain-containing protein, partial [Methylococcaceae bacterium]|nr:strawberry notch C-terminal domain-containing protein [Methylococcaceae bacterium]